MAIQEGSLVCGRNGCRYRLEKEIGAGASIQTLKNYTKDGCGMVLKASKENFQEAFVWLSSSMRVIGNSDSSRNKVDLDPLPKSITVEL